MSNNFRNYLEIDMKMFRCFRVILNKDSGDKANIFNLINVSDYYNKYMCYAFSKFVII